MKKIQFILALSIALLFCTCAKEIPIVLKPVLPAISIKPAIDIEITKATLVAKVVPNENGTTVSFEYKTLAVSTWATVPVSGTFSGKDSVEVSVALTALVANTEYSYRVKATNVAGETISSEAKFLVYALKDYDGNLYHTVTIGTQVWLKENLKTTHFANGDPIPNVTDATAWINLTTGAYCWYNNDPKLGEVYGALYNWHITNDPRGLIAGYHVATDEEWFIMTRFWGGPSCGGKLKEAGTAHWQSPNTGATNESGFSALPNGGRNSLDGNFESKGIYATFLSSTAIANSFWGKNLNYTKSTIDETAGYLQQAGFAIRLIKN